MKEGAYVRKSDHVDIKSANVDEPLPIPPMETIEAIRSIPKDDDDDTREFATA